MYLLTPTTVMGVCCSCASVCVSVSMHDKTKTAETTITKFATGIVQRLILGRKVKGHKVQKRIEGDRVASVS